MEIMKALSMLLTLRTVGALLDRRSHTVCPGRWLLHIGAPICTYNIHSAHSETCRLPKICKARSVGYRGLRLP